MPVLSRKLSRYSTLLACMAGLLVSALMMFLASAALVYQMMLDVGAQQARHAALIVDIGRQSNQLIDLLASDYKPDCTPQNLAKLNSLLFGYRFHKGIGLYDKNGLLYCTSGLGRLPQPVGDPPGGMRAKNGGLIWFSVPALIGEGRTATVMMRKGDFNVLLEPGTVKELLGATSVMWFGNGDKPVHVATGMSVGLLRAVERLDKAGEGGWHVLWKHGAIVSMVRVEPTLARFAEVRSLRDAYAGQSVLTALLLLLSLSLGTATGILLRQRLKRMNSLRYRLPGLLDEAHLLCVYQPIVDLATGKPSGCEVLVRLQDDEAVLVPDVFIPAVRDKKLTWQMDQAVMRAAFRELPQILEQIEGGKVAFNLFPESIRFDLIDPLFAPYKEAFAQHKVVLGVEVTEYDFSEQMIPELRKFEEAGYQISVDDFGTGYSNLNIIKKVAPHILKIDKSFVFEMEDASVRSSLIPEIVAIANAVRADVIAEGIENGQQARKLAAMGVRFGQGYFFGRPIPLSDFLAYLRAARAAGRSEAEGGMAAVL